MIQRAKSAEVVASKNPTNDKVELIFQICGFCLIHRTHPHTSMIGAVK
jgi:hypothetical protein